MGKISEFGPFRLYPSRHVLLCYGKPVPLTPEAFDLLTALVQNGGEAVGRDELLRRVWPDTYAEAANLTVHIEELNRKLGRTSDGRDYIETVPRKGYRFQLEVKHLGDDLEDAAETTRPPSSRDARRAIPRAAAGSGCF